MYVEKKQDLKYVNEEMYIKNFNSREQQYFYPVWAVNKYLKWEKHYLFVEPWRFVLRIRPNMITQARLINAELESQVARLKGFIGRNHLECRMDRARSRRHGSWRWKKHYVRDRIDLADYLKQIREEADYVQGE